jgi:hypothetical protein
MESEMSVANLRKMTHLMAKIVVPVVLAVLVLVQPE